MEIKTTIIEMFIVLFIFIILVGILAILITQYKQREVLDRDDTIIKSNIEINKINIYPAYNCEFINNRAEYWCFEENGDKT